MDQATTRRLKLIIAYDGSLFAGWQSQNHRNTIQDHLERVLKRMTGQVLRVHGAGRTDAGVHALGQCAHVDVPRNRMTSAQWTRALNASLPPAIRIVRTAYVSQNFHARFSAKGKVYRYRIWSGDVLPPFQFKRTWHLIAPIDFVLLEAAAGQFVGTHDFAQFAANRGKTARPKFIGKEDTVRTIYSVRVRRRGSCITIDFDGNGFLYKMVRLMVGAAAECALGKKDIRDLAENLRDRRGKSTRFVAPAEGLILLRVRY